MKTAIFITARMKSERLPKKVTKKIIDKPIIVHLIDRLKLSKRANFVAICTSTSPEDDILAEISQKEGIGCFRGSELDVLERLRDAARVFMVDLVISCTADNPFVDPVYIDKLIDFHIKNNNDYSKIDGLPFGTFSYAVSSLALEKVCEIKAEEDTEVWGDYFVTTGLFKNGTLYVEDDFLRKPYIRLTVDYPEDFELVTKIFENLYIPGEVFSLRDILKFLEDNPELLEINSRVAQKPGKPIKLKSGVNEDFKSKEIKKFGGK